MRLILKNISKRFGHHLALHPIDLDLASLSVLFFIGPSGSGKSTLLRILSGLEIPDTGHCVVNGETFQHEKSWLHDYRRRNGIVFQSFNLFPHLSAEANVMLPLYHVHGLSKADALEKTQEVLKRFGLASHASKRPNELSGGQRQRVAIARAVATDPQILFFDEPTSALDPEMTNEVLDLIAELKHQGKQLIVVTHAMGFARQVADHVAFFSEGYLIEHGPTVPLFEQPTTPQVQRFLRQVLKY